MAKLVFVKTGTVSHQWSFNTVQKRSNKAVHVAFCQDKNVVEVADEVGWDVLGSTVFPETQLSYPSGCNKSWSEKVLKFASLKLCPAFSVLQPGAICYVKKTHLVVSRILPFTF